MKWVQYGFLATIVGMTGFSAWMFAYTDKQLDALGVLSGPVFMAIIYYFVMRPALRQEALMVRLEKEGRRIQAAILSVKQTSMYINEVPVMRVKVKYIINGKEHVREVKQPVPYHEVGSLKPGKRIPILVDPKNNEQFLL